MQMIHAVLFYNNPLTPRTILEYNEPYDENMSVKEYVELFCSRVRKENAADRVEVMKMFVNKELIYWSDPKQQL